VAAGNLSGGEQQQLSLAMAFLIKPRLLCIDELSLGLSPTVVADLIDAVHAIHDQGTTVVIVEQSVNVALLLAERAVFLEKGQVRFSGPAAELLDRPDLLRAVFIGGGDAAPAKPKAKSRRKATAVVTEPIPAYAAVSNGAVSNGAVSNGAVPNGAVPNGAVSAADAGAGPALQAYGLVKRFGGITALNHVDLTVAPREVVGLIGHNGAGKTTLFDALSGFLRPDEGRIILAGHDVTARPAYERSVGGLGRSFHDTCPTATRLPLRSACPRQPTPRPGRRCASMRSSRCLALVPTGTARPVSSRPALGGSSSSAASSVTSRRC
jgi:branched-chain amino acid transport system ATP-binding protein